MRVGLGQHEKCYVKNSSFFLGGILISGGSSKIPSDQSDMLIYSMADALLGAASLGGIFQLENYSANIKNSGQKLLRQIEKDIHYLKFRISNIDITILTSYPDIENILSEIKSNLISWLYQKPEQLNLKVVPVHNTQPIQENIIKIISIALLENR